MISVQGFIFFFPFLQDYRGAPSKSQTMQSRILISQKI